jgi:hypothetical protein
MTSTDCSTPRPGSAARSIRSGSIGPPWRATSLPASCGATTAWYAHATLQDVPLMTCVCTRHSHSSH